MGKTLLELLDTYQFTKGLDPKSEKAGMLKPDPNSQFDVNIKQSKDWLKATPQIYGADIVRIMGQGAVDTKALKKATVKGAAQLASKIPIVGGIVGGAISQLTNPKLPGDLITGTEEDPNIVYSSLYTDLLYGKIRNDKGALGNFLQANGGLKNLGQNLKNVAVSAAISGVQNVAAAGLDALINKKKFTLKKPKLPSVKPPIGKLYTDNFPSTFAFQSGITDNIAVNQTQFTNRPGILGGTFGAGFELGKAGDKITITKLTNNPTANGLIKGTENRLNDLYTTIYKRFESKLNGMIPSINLWQAGDDKSANPYNYEKINGNTYSELLKNYYTADTADFTQFYGTGYTDSSPTIDVKDDLQNKSKFTHSDGLDNIVRYNTFNAPVSKNINKILENDIKFVTGSAQTQINRVKTTNPYLDTKIDVLTNNKVDDRLAVTIGDINFLSIVKGLSDKLNPNWDTVKPVGSGLNFYLFNNWEREISFDLMLYAENKEQVKQIWTKVNSLSKFTMGKPTSNSRGVFGQIIGLKLGNLIKESGFLSGLSTAVDDSAPWEIDPKSQAPLVFTVSVSFKVVTNQEANSYNFYEIAKA